MDRDKFISQFVSHDLKILHDGGRCHIRAAVSGRRQCLEKRQKNSLPQQKSPGPVRQKRRRIRGRE